jgi:anion-transporting  ArsA/GET3 family ATPase
MTPHVLPPPLTTLLAHKRVVLCVGAGGVGKTTLSAALGVAAAQEARRALVLTVDPARRLASALGLQQFDEHIQAIEPAKFAAQGATVAVALDAAMLDVKRTFDRVVTRYARSPQAAEAILKHPFYQQASTALAGSQEYMATERLYECATEGRHDLVILDTPPAEHALDFLDAPSRLVDLFDAPAFRMLVRPSQRMGSGLFRSGSLVMRGLQKFTSADMFSNLLQFFGHLSETFDGFVQRARDVDALLHSPDAAFVIVSGCDGVSLHQGELLRAQLESKGLTVAAWLVNRVAPFAQSPVDQTATATAVQSALTSAQHAPDLPALGDQQDLQHMAERISQMAASLARMARADAAAVAALRTAHPHLPIYAVTRSANEPDGLAELARLAALLRAGGAPLPNPLGEAAL